ncbi:anaerobic sulfite reductase subunit AsrA [Clostridium beijerinckii]|jgi:anaerobic sulfite reductase subunit A|uniref:Anaerobic sulfite reductase subunit A n=1 Tax=Clostridium beijerinckii TaxID=1520 RepID=A0AAW3W8A4_CLOBE|nr:anaerobic sulfite reductase subunit AsrA [Clostridium beijerinckii]MBC2457944.1 anaerobic sulfite reductase subunit A [Clostridium beijerinckii]MBC2475194.1 anaerobic sulfite reductase subunit A [Clostridium beijerinckii]MCI1477405.1 anaerobic sulfite reductase subunit AsrA [Clostridium beijerinckii]MCI1576974.1 anaerobic sulfite reductase subunit AsrA [Clostridium beijerinckii]MCI1582816.1 anaerobic sulfite reductase subunit AsrA [Clostridium beijerinckii]
MGYKLSKNDINKVFEDLSKEYVVYAPKLFEGEGSFSDTDRVRYGEIKTIDDIVFDQKAQYSYKEVLLPISQTLFYFTEDSIKEADAPKKGAIIFLRSCDLHAVKRMDDIYLRNGQEDYYYKRIRENAKFILMGCENSFENCFCVSMETNKNDEYNAYLKVNGDNVYVDIKDEELGNLFKVDETLDVKPDFVTENSVKVSITDNLSLDVMKSDMWKEYSARCIACGRCNFVCPTCTCFTMQDVFYTDNGKAGERRRVWASCHVDGYTNMAGGHSFRLDKGQRMRFKVLHKVYDYKKKWGYHMCVGCGRCDDICPEYISFSNCVNKLKDGMKEVADNE